MSLLIDMLRDLAAARAHLEGACTAGTRHARGVRHEVGRIGAAPSRWRSC